MIKKTFSQISSLVVILVAALGLTYAMPLFAATTATLSLSPASKMVVMGEEIEIQVMLDTAGNATDGVDIRYLRFNPAYAEILDADPTTAGIQIQPGTLYPMTTANSVDVTNGTIQFSQITSGGTKYSGSGVLATIRLRIKDGNSVDLLFDFTPGVTNDSNVASSGGQDVLASVQNARFVFSTQGNMTGSSSGSGGNGSSSGYGSSGGGGGSGSYAVSPTLIPSSALPPLPGNFPVPPSQPRVVAQLTRSLYRGLRHAQVTILQNFLIGKNYLAATNNSGFFGALTEKAVKAFQCAEKIVCSGTALSTGYGSVGAKTRARINVSLSIVLGGPGSAEVMKNLQQQLIQLQLQLSQLLQASKR